MLTARWQGLLALGLACVMWSTTYVVAKPHLDVLPPLAMALSRFLIAALILVPIGLKQPGPLPGRLTLLALGFFGVAGFYFCFNVGLQLTSASVAALIQGSGPAITAVVAFFLLGERLCVVGVVGLLLSAGGIALIVLSSGPEGQGSAPLLGGSLVLGSAICWACYTVLCRRLIRYPPLRLTAAGAIAGTLLLAPLAAVEASLIGLGHPGVGTWLAVVYLAVGPSALAYLLWSYGLQVISANHAGAFLNLIPVLGLALAALVLGERPPPPALAGGALVLTGVWITTRARPSRSSSLNSARRSSYDRRDRSGRD